MIKKYKEDWQRYKFKVEYTIKGKIVEVETLLQEGKKRRNEHLIFNIPLLIFDILVVVMNDVRFADNCSVYLICLYDS